MNTANIPLSKLKLSKRNHRADKDINDLAKSIAEVGLLTNLTVIPNGSGETYEVVAGGRRLAALKKINFKEPVPCTIIEANSAEAASLAENYARKGFTPYELLRAIKATKEAKGKPLNQQELADLIGVSVTQIRGSLRLANIHPTILAAAEAEERSQSDLQGYGATENQDDQLRVFESAERWQRWNPNSVRHALGFQWDIAEKLERVGVAAYKKRGGVVYNDLFGDSKAVSDEELLHSMLCDWYIEEDKRLAKKHGFEILESTEGYRSPWMRHDDDGNLIFDEDRTYFINGGEFWVIDEYPTSSPTPTPDATEPETDPLAPSQKAIKELAEMRVFRRADLSEATLNGSWVHVLGFAIGRQLRNQWAQTPGLMSISTHHYRDMFDEENKPEWLTESDTEKAWELYSEDTATNLHFARLLASITDAGEHDAFYDRLIAKTNLAWTSTTEFWALFRKKEQLLARIEEFAPEFAKQLESKSAAIMRSYAHEACLGRISEKHGHATISEEEAKAAQAWVPAELRFGDQ